MLIENSQAHTSKIRGGKMKNFKKIFAIILVVALTLVLASCSCKKTPVEEKKDYTFNEYLSLSPSNWNQLTYQDNNDTEIMSYIGSNFFTFDFKFDSKGEIVDGDFQVKYSAATKLEDVTAKYAGDEKYAVPEDEESGYAYVITLRDDLKWEDGTPIKAEDFVYTMKQQLDPLFKNYRADSFYNSGLVIHNAREYVYQGDVVMTDNYGVPAIEGIDDMEKGADGKYTYKGQAVYFPVNVTCDWIGGSNRMDQYAGAGYLDATAFAALQALADENGYAPVTDETIALYGTLISAVDAWGETADNWPVYLQYDFEYPAVNFEDVGIFVGANELEIVLVLDKPLYLLKEDGSLSYLAAYQMSDLPLVKKDLFEANKVAPVEGSTLWTSTYCSSKETTASWGPYKLTDFQTGKAFTLEKNENWYGYAMEENKGLYQTTKIECEIIAEYETAFMKFLKGEIDSIGITAQYAPDYKNSEQAIFTPSDYVGSLQLQSSYEALKNREEEGKNKTILAQKDFRNAISLAINRAEYANKCTTASLAGYGIFTPVHYYDVENGGAYRFTDPAKKTLCNVYGVDVTKYASLDEAYATITGYNLDLARQLLESAYQNAKAAGDIKDTDTVLLTFGTGSDTTTVRARFEFLKEALVELAKGTSLEGRLDAEFKDFGSKWANDFRDGGYDLCMGGWTGAAWDPGYFLLAYLSPSYMYSRAWDTSAAMMEFEMPIGDGKTVKETMSLIDWYNCLNGLAGAKYNWASGNLDEQYRLELIAALEEQILAVYYTVPLVYDYSASLISYKWEYITRDYNTFVGYGGLKYIKYNYDDVAWAEYVASQGGEINYKK